MPLGINEFVATGFNRWNKWCHPYRKCRAEGVRLHGG